MRTEVEFDADGTTLRGWLYRPEGSSGALPVVVMAHGFSAVKEMYLDAYAAVFSQAGMAALVFDNRCFGASDGEPRQEIDPWAQVRDYRDAITWAQLQDDLDGDRIGVWGSSYSGGHALVVAAIDRRVRCVVSQVPLISGSQNLARLIRCDVVGQVRAMFDEDRRARFRGEPPQVVPVVDPDPAAMCALPTPDSWEWFSRTGKDRAPAWRNEVTVRSIELLSEYEPGSYIERISPTPLLMVVAAGDHLAVSDLALEAYNRAREPKRLALLPGGHFEAYTGSGFDRSSKEASDWFRTHLGLAAA
jgi:uncharacterized protein